MYRHRLWRSLHRAHKTQYRRSAHLKIGGLLQKAVRRTQFDNAPAAGEADVDVAQHIAFEVRDLLLAAVTIRVQHSAGELAGHTHHAPNSNHNGDLRRVLCVNGMAVLSAGYSFSQSAMISRASTVRVHS